VLSVSLCGMFLVLDEQILTSLASASEQRIILSLGLYLQNAIKPCCDTEDS